MASIRPHAVFWYKLLRANLKQLGLLLGASISLLISCLLLQGSGSGSGDSHGAVVASGVALLLIGLGLAPWLMGGRPKVVPISLPNVAARNAIVRKRIYIYRDISMLPVVILAWATFIVLGFGWWVLVLPCLAEGVILTLVWWHKLGGKEQYALLRAKRNAATNGTNTGTNTQPKKKLPASAYIVIGILVSIFATLFGGYLIFSGVPFGWFVVALVGVATVVWIAIYLLLRVNPDSGQRPGTRGQVKIALWAIAFAVLIIVGTSFLGGHTGPSSNFDPNKIAHGTAVSFFGGTPQPSVPTATPSPTATPIVSKAFYNGDPIGAVTDAIHTGIVTLQVLDGDSAQWLGLNDRNVAVNVVESTAPIVCKMPIVFDIEQPSLDRTGIGGEDATAPIAFCTTTAGNWGYFVSRAALSNPIAYLQGESLLGVARQYTQKYHDLHPNDINVYQRPGVQACVAANIARAAGETKEFAQQMANAIHDSGWFMRSYQNISRVRDCFNIA